MGSELSCKFIQFNEDLETKEFIDSCYVKSEWFLTQLFHSVMFTVLKFFMANTSINGLLKRGSMFVFSMQQFKSLIDFEATYGNVKLNSLLDLGAGDGEVTAKMAPLFQTIYVTEMSYTMQWRLQQKGFKVLDVNTWDKIELDARAQENESINIEKTNKYLKYDVISCLNLLDRCETPITLLKSIKDALVPNGLLVVALVLPFKSFYEYNRDNRPVEDLFDIRYSAQISNEVYKEHCMAMTNQTAQCAQPKPINPLLSQISYLVNFVFKPIGFELVKFTKLPYLCEGNLSQSYFFMNDYVFVFKSV